jgi:4,5-DOPA dioxygenase extradiol
MPRLPAIFFGHGSPLNALDDNAYTRAWAAFGASIPRPRAILAISAHWYTRGTLVTAMERPPTIHDFGGFPRELHEFSYPAPGDPELAARVSELLAPLAVGDDHAWGLDHGTWSVLTHVFPNADVPVVQLSIDATAPPAAAIALGRALAPLRDDGVLIAGSGNIVHNLAAMYAGGRSGDAWAARFEAHVTTLLEADDPGALADPARLGPDAARAIPTPEHYLPLLYVAGARLPDDELTFPASGTVFDAISMLSVRFG